VGHLFGQSTVMWMEAGELAAERGRGWRRRGGFWKILDLFGNLATMGNGGENGGKRGVDSTQSSAVIIDT
jgi:hypothetical protein